MTRTIVDIDDPILRTLKRLQKQQPKSLGRLISDPLPIAITYRRASEPRPTTLAWISRPMKMKIDLRGKEAVRAALEGPRRKPHPRRTSRRT